MNKQILDIALNEYYREFERKTRLENKATGYLTIVSIILAASIGLFAFIYQLTTQSNVRLIQLVVLICECYFAILSIGYALSAQKTRILGSFDFTDLEKEFYKNNNAILIFNTLKAMTEENIIFNSDLEEKIDISYMFVWFSIIIFIIQFITSIIFIGGQL